MNFDDDNEMWKHSEIMRTFVDRYLNKLEAEQETVIEASVEDPILDESVPLVQNPEQMSVIDIKDTSAALIDNLNKLADLATKYNNEKVSYAIEQAIAEIKLISGLDQE